VELLTVRVPELLKAPPFLDVELPEIMELLTVRVPELLRAPPLVEVCAPETVVLKIARLPPVLILKMLKSRPVLPLSPLMVREEALGPLMVRAPAVPPVIAVLALTMLGNAELKVMV
jgi:hypothetical protein